MVRRYLDSPQLQAPKPEPSSQDATSLPSSIPNITTTDVSNTDVTVNQDITASLRAAKSRMLEAETPMEVIEAYVDYKDLGGVPTDTMRDLVRLARERWQAEQDEDRWAEEFSEALRRSEDDSSSNGLNISSAKTSSPNSDNSSLSSIVGVSSPSINTISSAATTTVTRSSSSLDGSSTFVERVSVAALSMVSGLGVAYFESQKAQHEVDSVRATKSYEMARDRNELIATTVQTAGTVITTLGTLYLQSA